jgi:hypothetical protein
VRDQIIPNVRNGRDRWRRQLVDPNHDGIAEIETFTVGCGTQCRPDDRKVLHWNGSDYTQ